MTSNTTSKTQVTLLSLPEAVDVLREHYADTEVLSAYLDTSPQRTDGPAWALALRDGCKAIRRTLADPVAEGFEAAVELAESYLSEDFARALDQQASIEVVRGDAAIRLMEQGGIAAWTR